MPTWHRIPPWNLPWKKRLLMNLLQPLMEWKFRDTMQTKVIWQSRNSRQLWSIPTKSFPWGVEAHHQNGIAERYIKELTSTFRTLLFHGQRHWHQAMTTMLKPAEENHTALRCDEEDVTLLFNFSTVDTPIWPYHYHIWGFPVYVLDACLQSGNAGPPKWKSRSCLGLYVGYSLFHASTVALVLKPRADHVSPQFYVVYDENISTLSSMRKCTVPSNWADLVARVPNWIPQNILLK